MNNQLEQILKDLYQLDPELRNYEKELIKTIKVLLAAKPDTKFDIIFAKKLKKELMAKTGSVSADNEKIGFFQKFQKLSFNFAIPVTAAAVLLIIAVVYTQRPGDQSQLALDLFSGSAQIENLKDNAFGKLAQTEDVTFGGFGGSTNVPAPSFEKALDSRSSAIGGGEEIGIAPPEFINYKFIYKGGEFTIDEEQMKVYKRDAKINARQAAEVIKNLNFGLVDVNTFENLELRTVSLVENKDFGYEIHVVLNEGIININQNWPSWPTVVERTRLSEASLPEDEKLINIAKNFLAQHNIPTSPYGEPFVNQPFAINPASSSKLFAPDIVSVIFPIKIEGQEIYEQSGNLAGLTVNISIAQNRVAGVYELRPPNFQASIYNVETDVQKLIEFAEKGGYHGNIFFARDGHNATELELGSPTLALARYWQNTFNFSEELFAPSLIFPIEQANTPGFYRSHIVVPLVEDLLNSDFLGLPGIPEPL